MTEYAFTDPSGVERFRGGISPAPGGSGAVLSQRVVIPHADILTLPTTPVEIVAAPDAGAMVLPVSAFLVGDTTAGAYSGFDAGAIIGFDPDGSFAAYPLMAQLGEGINSGVSNLLGGSQPVLAITAAPLVKQAGTTVSTVVAFVPLQDPVAFDGMPLLLACDNGGNDFADGNAANTLTVTVFYALVTL